MATDRVIPSVSNTQQADGETEAESWFPGTGGKGQWRDCCFMAEGLHFGVCKPSGTRWWWLCHSIVTVLSIAEVHTLNWIKQWILCYMCLHAPSLQPCPTLRDHIDCNLPGSSVPGDSLGKNTGVGCHSLLQGIFPTQGSSPRPLHFLHWRWIL